MAATLRDYYAARAPEYDKVYSKPERQADLRELERWLPPLFAASDVLEIACGTGLLDAIPGACSLLGSGTGLLTRSIADARERVPDSNVRFVAPESSP
jgi:hypothetical protein